MKQTPELSQQYKSDVQTIHLLLAIDRYLIQVRKLRHAKEEKVKATYNAHRERTHRNETATTKGRGTRLETATTIAKTEITSKESRAGKESKLTSKKTRIDDHSTIKENMTEVAESAAACNYFSQ